MSNNNINKLDVTNIGNYLKKVTDTYGEKKSMIDIFDQFRCMSKEFQNFNNRGIKEHNYSSYIYSECTPEEQEDFRLNNLMTLESLVINSIYEHQGFLYSWSDIYDLLLDPLYKNTEKTSRKVIFPSISTQRPVGERSYDMWNGLQIIDIDIKNERLANEIKYLIFDDLKKYNWFLGICKSASGKSLHVWTKITPLSIDHSNRKIEYLCNFRHKYSYLYIVLSKYMDKFGYDKDQIMQFMDMAMAKPQQGIFISSDSDPLMNTNFIDLRLDVNFESAFNTGIESINWISHPDLKPMFSKLEWFNSEKSTNDTPIDSDNISNINERDISKSVRKHYKHAQRWQLANTLAAIYGYDKALSIMTEICKNTDFKELKGDVKTATVHNKPISLWAIKELNKNHGFNIKIKELEDYYEDDKKKLVETTEDIYKSPTAVLNSTNEIIKLYLTKSQFLSHIKDDIMKELTNINLLEAGAGYGKTEMIKGLNGKTLLILPFTSTIKSKIEADNKTDDWLSFYGTKRPQVSDLLSPNSMSMTIDKFSRLNIMELDAAEFDYIVLDESHLLFTSSYRDVMSPTIQRLANCKAKVIMMTGTPTGELLFFPNIKHIKVIKEDVRDKSFEIHMCPTKTEKLVEMCKSMANDILEGKKILFPTNKGNLYFEQIKGIIQKFLEEKSFGREINCFYYKKSNYGDESMDSINIDKSIGNNDIIFCTNYLSVGVDICDRYNFSVYFNEQWIPQDIEQFANRLRNNDLYIKLFLHEYDEVGVPINYYYTQELDLSFNEADILLARDLIRTANDMIERNNEESKYNPLIQSLLSANKYLKYDENDCKYYIDETTYKLAVFEERYSSYAKQLEILTEGMKYYGYKVDVVNHTDKISDSRLEEVQSYLKSCRRMRYNYNTSQTFALLNHTNDANMDLYKEVMNGNYDILKGDEYKNDRLNYDLYVEDIEIIEKNLPIIFSLYKFYDCEIIKDIFEYCIEKKQNKINYAKLDRIKRFVTIEYNRKKKRLDFPIMRFIKDTQDWAKKMVWVESSHISEFLDEYACKYANSIKDVVIEDVEYLKMIREFIERLFNVVVIKGRAKNGLYPVEPFELLWETKESIKDIYGNNMTKEFFLQELVDNIKDEKEVENNEEEIPELEHTSKLKLDDIKQTLTHVINKGFDYEDYSVKDGSNERFLNKQKKENSISGTLFDQEYQNNEKEKDKEHSLFDFAENNIYTDSDGLDVPF